MSLPFAKKMGSRTVEVKPVGAWVYPEVSKNHYETNAQVRAAEEEERIRLTQREKEQRLRQFQEDVRQRVQKLEQQRRHLQLQSSAKAVELERHVIKQSVMAAHKATPRKNNCTLRTNHADLSIQQNQGTQPHQKNSEVDLGEESTRAHAQYLTFWRDSSDMAARHTRRARSKLVSRKVDVDDYGRDNLPESRFRPVECTHPVTEGSLGGMDSTEEKITQKSESTGRSVGFDLDSLRNQLNRLSSSHGPTGVEKSLRNDPVPMVPEIYPGQTTQDEKQQSVQQRALYRRLFMDIEREQVREKQRKEKHRQKIAQLKNDKEEDRKRVELASLRLTQSETDLPDSEPDEQEVERTEELERSEREEVEERRSREANRFVEALKQRLREKLQQREVQLPALCCCGDSIWDTDPNTCANNCVFYRNHRAYTKALQCVLASCDTL